MATGQCSRCLYLRSAAHCRYPITTLLQQQCSESIHVPTAATSNRLMQARTDLLLMIVDQLQKEGVLYTLPPYQDGSPSRCDAPEDVDPNLQPQNIRNDKHI